MRARLPARICDTPTPVAHGFAWALTFVAAASLTVAAPVAAQMRAPDIPTVCLSEPAGVPQVECATKYYAFYAYLGQMAMGNATYSLPTELADALQPFYPGINLSQWRFGFSDRQPLDNATTACEVTWFNSSSMVDQLRTAENLRRVHWLAHELRHYEQCVEVGGRDAYSKLWWDDLDAVVLEQLLRGGNMDDVHDAMGMEDNAENRADDVLDGLLECCIHPVYGNFVPAARFDGMQLSRSTIKLGESLTMSVSGSDGAEPWYYRWEAQNGADVDYIGNDESETWEPEGPGTWTVRVRVSQAVANCEEQGSLPCLLDDRVVVVEERTPTVTDLRFDETTLEPGETTMAYLTATDIARDEMVNATLISDGPLAEVPSLTKVEGVGAWQGEGSFMVTVPSMPEGTVLFGERSVRIRAGFEGVDAPFHEAYVRVRGYEVQDFRAVAARDRMGREIYEIRVQLDRRVRGPVTLQLETSDSRSLSVPTEITIPAGAAAATVRVSPPRTLRTATDVTVRLRHAAPEFTTRESTLTVRPGGG